jgi:general secretion pathway protein G
MLLRDLKQQRKRSAFTLLEIMVVAAIILILAGAGAVVLPRFINDARINRAKLDVKTLGTAVMAYQVKNGSFPNSLEELANQQPDGGLAYIEKTALIDPWNNRYEYSSSSLHPRTGTPRISSQGPPGQTVYISNWPAD